MRVQPGCLPNPHSIHTMISRLFSFFCQRPRLALLAFGLLCYGAVGSAVLLGWLFDMEVCAMCWYQRLSFLFAGSGFLLAAAWPRGAVVTQRLGALGLLSALASSARQSYLLINPAAADGSCGAGLGYYWKIGAYDKFFRAGLVGGSDCAENQPLILGLYLPQWSLLAVIIIIALYLVWQFRRRYSR